MHFGVSHGKKNPKSGVRLKDLKRKKKRGNISQLMRKEDYAQGESE